MKDTVYFNKCVEILDIYKELHRHPVDIIYLCLEDHIQ